jgi:hypothetical protein
MKAARSSLGVSLGEGVMIGCHTYPHDPDAGPILYVHAPGFSFTLSARSRGAVEAGDVQMARRLAEAAATFAADMERLAQGGGASECGERAA